jgi:hypothetical protein
LGAGGFLKRKRIDDLKLLWRIAKPRRSSDLGEEVRDLTLRRTRDQSPSGFGVRHLRDKSVTGVEIASRDSPI